MLIVRSFHMLKEIVLPPYGLSITSFTFRRKNIQEMAPIEETTSVSSNI